MGRALFVGFLALLTGLSAGCVFARAQNGSASSIEGDSAKPKQIDGIAVRIGSDVITESEIQQLAAYQTLVDGKSQSRSDVIRELIDQWIVRGEASAAQYPQPLTADVDKSLASLEKQFGSVEEFKKRCIDAGIGEESVRRIVTEQIYLSRFLDFRFRPAAQVDASQVQKYYDEDFVPRLKAKGDKIPPLSDVQSQIREVLIQQEIDALSKQWLDDTRSGLSIDILPQGEGQ